MEFHSIAHEVMEGPRKERGKREAEVENLR